MDYPKLPPNLIIAILLIAIAFSIYYYNYLPHKSYKTFSYNIENDLEYGVSLCLCTSDPNVSFEYNENKNMWIPTVKGKNITIFECSKGTRWIPLFNPSDENITNIEIIANDKTCSTDHILRPDQAYAFKMGKCHKMKIEEEYEEIKIRWCKTKECFERNLSLKGWP